VIQWLGYTDYLPSGFGWLIIKERRITLKNDFKKEVSYTI
jgi:hypothetical protein